MSGNGIDPAARDKYLLQVTTGPSYDSSQHEQVSVNGSEPTRVESDSVTAWIRVRIKGYHGLPRGSPSSSSYFDHEQHVSDRYSIAYSFIPKHDMSGSDLVMGFDYGHSIKHQLPPGFRYAMKIATSVLDPGIYSDAYSDEPYLYGPALSSFFAFRIGDRTSEVSAEDQLARLAQETDGVTEEGAEGSGKEARKASGMPSKWKKRRKHYLDAQALSDFTFEKGRMYHADFFNPHLDFANFSLRLPGFSISVARYVDEKTHHLRYVLRNRTTEEVLFVVLFKLLFGQELDDTLERQKGQEEKNDVPVAADGPISKGTGHDELTKVIAAEESERRASQRRAEVERKQADSAERRSTEPEPRGEYQGDQSYMGQATSAASNLANSVVAVYAALGFGTSSSESSESEASSRSSSPQRDKSSMALEIDDMDNATVERYLQSRYGSV
ncbi:DUF1769-domain-containing protein [Decorospora gaudefroyi]|uniref:DUF1769-domain-containing protein n=1 Tax=Decorospora gaudefroyi TaxID=184978 RepID=A0A6A5KC24_9PLEO|nr:DUF1769-domain-containing protein [Decorospora gaudefroyi]